MRIILLFLHRQTLKYNIMEQIQNYDFSGKRVRFMGKCMTKFELSFHISHLKPLSPYAIYPDAYPYVDYVIELKSCLS